MLEVIAPQARCEFGIARRDITPPVGIYHRMWGAATHDRSEGVHRPLTATATAFSQSRETANGAADELVVLAVDHCLMRWPEHDDLVRTVTERAGIDRDALVVTFSHTHAAGLMDRDRHEFPGGELIGPYLDQLNATCAELVAAARAAMRPATIVCGTGRCDMAAHRDLWDADAARWVCGFNPDGSVDDLVLVARIVAASGDGDGNAGEPATLATFVNYGCHPTTLAWQNRRISPDYPGAMRQLVEDATGAPCVFLLGACGDVGPRQGFTGDVAVADRNGRRLGHAALSALESLPNPLTRCVYAGPVISGATIGTWADRPLDAAAVARSSVFRRRSFVVDLLYRESLQTREQLAEERNVLMERERSALAGGDTIAARDSRALLERNRRWRNRIRDLPPGQTFPYPVTLLRTGEIHWLFVEGEPYQSLQRALRAQFPATPIFVAVLSNGTRASYLLPAESHGAGSYPDEVAVLAPGCLETLIEEIAAAIARV